MTVVTLTSKGQMTLPKDIRDRLELKAGDKLDVSLDSTEAVVLRKRKRLSLGELRRSLPPRDRPVEQTDIDRAVGEAITDRAFRR